MAPDSQEYEDPGAETSDSIEVVDTTIFTKFDLDDLTPPLDVLEDALSKLDMVMGPEDVKAVADLVIPGIKPELKDAVVKLAIHSPGQEQKKELTQTERARAELETVLIALDDLDNTAITRYIKKTLISAGIKLNNVELAEARTVINKRMQETAHAVKTTIEAGHHATKTTKAIVEEVRSRLLQRQFTMTREGIRNMVESLLIEDVDTEEVLKGGRETQSGTRTSNSNEGKKPKKRRRLTRTGSGKDGK